MNALSTNKKVVVEAFSECVLRNFVDTFTCAPWPVARRPTQYFYLFTQQFTLPTSRTPDITAALSAAYWQKPFPNQLFRNRRNSPKSQQKAQTVITHATFGFNFLGCALPSIARHSSRHLGPPFVYQNIKLRADVEVVNIENPVPQPSPSLASLAFSICKIATFCISCNLFTTEHASIAGYWLGLKSVVIGENVFKYQLSTPKHGRYGLLRQLASKNMLNPSVTWRDVFLSVSPVLILTCCAVCWQNMINQEQSQWMASHCR